MRRSNPSKHTRQRFGRKVSSIGARQLGLDGRLERLRILALVAQVATTNAGQSAIYARRCAQGKRV